MSTPPPKSHESILGRARYFLLVFMGIMLSGAWMKQCGQMSGSEGAVKTSLILAISFLGAWMATSDDFIRISLWVCGAVPATYGAFRFGLVVGDSFVQDSGALTVYSAIWAAVFLIAGGIWWGQAIKTSRFFGVRCIRCERRGGVDSTEIDRSYMGMTRVGDSLKREYSVTYRNDCSYCHGTWQSQGTVYS